MKTNVTFPFILIAQDYHEFYGMDKLLSFVLNEKVKCWELPTDGGEYRAVFYIGKRPSKKELKNLKSFYKA